MAYNIVLPFHVFKFVLEENVNEIIFPLSDMNAYWMNEPVYLLTGKYAELYQQKVLNKGNLLEILDLYKNTDYHHFILPISFEVGAYTRRISKFTIPFDCYYTKTTHTYIGVIPIIGIESAGETLEDLKNHLERVIRMEFTQNSRLVHVQSILPTLWIDRVEMQTSSLEWWCPEPNEVKEIEEKEDTKWLSKIGKKLSIYKQISYGRTKELKQLKRALKNGYTRNVLLVGTSGVGKTALVWELARQRADFDIAGEIWETTASILIKELTAGSGWQDNMMYLCKEIKKEEAILYIRNLMELFEVGQYAGNSISMAMYLKPLLEQGDLTLISECTEDEMAYIELHHPQYLSIFQVVKMTMPEGKLLEQIVTEKTKSLSYDHKIKIDKAAIQEIIRLNLRFSPYSGFPGKPIRALESMMINALNADKSRITQQDVIHYFAEDAGMPLSMIDPSIPMDLITIKKEFNQNVFGQPQAINSLVDMLATVKTALSRSGQPIASFLFVGPTGVGKTELAKVLAQFMFGARDRLERFDMSEYASPYAVTRLIGSSLHQDGILTSAIKRQPFSVLLFDEIEKAHPSFYDLLLQILSEGRLTDNHGKLVNFCTTIIIMTSNIGAGNLQSNRIRINDKNENVVETHFVAAVKQFFRPELYNRIDSILPFSPLTREVVRSVVDREIEQFKRREGIRYRRLNLQIEPQVLDYLADKGYNPKYGARQLQRVMREEMIIPLAKALNLEDYDDQLMVTININEQNRKDGISIEVKADEFATDLLIEELDKITNAGMASEIRRSVDLLMDGVVYMKVLNEISQLERKKRKDEKSFWNKKKSVQRYNAYASIQSDIEELKLTIEKLELDFSLACMGLTHYYTDLEVQLELCKDSLFQQKIQLVSTVFPKINSCHFAIYGFDIEPIIKFYVDWFKEKRIDFTAHTVWYRESYYQEYIYPEVTKKDGTRIVEKRQRKAYIKKDYKVDSKDNYKPLHLNDQFVGIEFTLSNEGVYLYWQPEVGAQQWKLSKDESTTAMIMINNDVFATPDKIHRKRFYSKNTVRRWIDLERDWIKDRPLNINKEMTLKDWKVTLNTNLENLFKQAVAIQLFG